MSIAGPLIHSNRCPAADESELGTVHDEAITKIRPDIENTNPVFFAFPLTENHIPSGISINGIQNQIAASSIESMHGRER